MSIERKFIDLKSLKVSDEGPGTIEGYRSVFSVIDEGGDIIIPGAFKDTLAEYLESGFTAHSHDWDFDKAVGYPVEAHEDEHGWYVTSQFHSTPDAQAVRTKAKERMDAGKKVGFSFGYSPTEYTHVEAKDYETELAKYVKAENLQETLAKAQKFNRIRILKKVDAIEDSLVTAPMNKRAAATAVKSEPSPEAGDETPNLKVRHCRIRRGPALTFNSGGNWFCIAPPTIASIIFCSRSTSHFTNSLLHSISNASPTDSSTIPTNSEGRLLNLLAVAANANVWFLSERKVCDGLNGRLALLHLYRDRRTASRNPNEQFPEVPNGQIVGMVLPLFRIKRNDRMINCVTDDDPSEVRQLIQFVVREFKNRSQLFIRTCIRVHSYLLQDR